MSDTQAAAAAPAGGAPAREMTFHNFGGLFQLEVRDAQDLAAIDRLDPAQWAATSAPAADLRCDPGFLAALDPEKNGRIRVSQVLAEREWMLRHLAGRDRVSAKTETLRLADIDASHDPGARIRRAAERVLAEIGAADRGAIDLAQVRLFRKSYVSSLANGDGIVPPEQIADPEAADLVRDVMATAGSAMDASGKPGIGTAHLDRFLDGGRAYLAWKAEPAADAGRILPWGEETAPAAALVRDLEPKVEQYFRQCDLVLGEPRAAERLRLTDDQLEALDVASPAAIERALAGAPLAPPRASGALPLGEGVNPLYAERLAALREKVVARLRGAGPAEIGRADWAAVRAHLEPHFAWLARRPPEPFEKVPEGRLRADLEPGHIARVRDLIATDLAAAEDLKHVSNLERLILSQRWLVELVNNFVNFSAIYDPDMRSLIDVGTLIIDGRRLEFIVRVADRAAHRKVAAESRIFLVYAKVSERDGGAGFEVAAPVTSGERGRLRPGKRGIFMDVDGKEADAEVVEILENPISLWEAVKAPFRRASAFVSKKIEDFAATQLATGEKTLEQVAVGAAPPGAPAAAAKPAAAGGPPGGTIGMLLVGGGVAFAAISAALASIVSSLAQVQLLSALKAVATIVLAVGGVAAFLGWLKLRRRDMGLLLEANGWSLNVHMRLTGRLGRLFTRVPPLPEGSRRVHVDALERIPGVAHSPRARKVALALLALAALLGVLGIAWWAGWMGSLPWVRDR